MCRRLHLKKLLSDQELRTGRSQSCTLISIKKIFISIARDGTVPLRIEYLHVGFGEHASSIATLWRSRGARKWGLAQISVTEIDHPLADNGSAVAV